MSFPVLNMGTERCWVDVRDPTPEEPVEIETLNFWFNEASNTLFICVDANDPQSLMWKQITFQAKKTVKKR